METGLQYNATVVGRQALTPDLFILQVRPDAPRPAFASGQYVLLGAFSDAPRREGSAPEAKPAKPGRMVLRAYSIASPGNEPDTLEFYISVVSQGSLTPRLVAFEVGARLHVGEKIRGFFTLDAVGPGQRNVVLAATGTGLAPYLSMLRGQAGAALPFRILLVHGAPYSWELGYFRELRLFERVFPNFAYLPLVSRPQKDTWWKGGTGRITPLFEGATLEERFGFRLDPAETSVFLCGNPDMIREVTDSLAGRGYLPHKPGEAGSLHTEEYW